jgi:MSHA pilin protein MshD
MFIRRPSTARAEQGISLIELVTFIVIVGVAVGGILLLMNLTTRHSADPLLHKQALAVAEALLEEIELMPFTTCDPDGYDAVAGTCNAPAVAEAIGPEAAHASQSVVESRDSAVAPFDNVNDYHGFTLAGGALDLGGSATVVVPAGYSASVDVTEDAAFGPAGLRVPQAAALRIRVTVTYSGGSIVLEGYRTRYAPTVTP